MPALLHCVSDSVVMHVLPAQHPVGHVRPLHAASVTMLVSGTDVSRDELSVEESSVVLPSATGPSPAASPPPDELPAPEEEPLEEPLDEPLEDPLDDPELPELLPDDDELRAPSPPELLEDAPPESPPVSAPTLESIGIDASLTKSLPLSPAPPVAHATPVARAIVRASNVRRTAGSILKPAGCSCKQAARFHAGRS